jgi:hypothetical protein
MKVLIQIFGIFILFISCKKDNKKSFIPKINDSIPITNYKIKTDKMLEGGYELIGVEEEGKPFEIKNLAKKKKEYFLKYFTYYNSTQSNQNFEYEEIIEIDESEFSIIKPESPVIDIYERPYRLGNENLEIYIDINQILNMPNYTENSEIVKELKKEVNDVIEYSNTIKKSYTKYYEPSKKLVQSFPVFIFNKTDSIIPLELKEGWIFMIQEAKNRKGEWKPIEYYEPYTYCGNSFGSEKLIPNHYAISKIYKYEGTFNTKLRLKLMTNNRIYYSNEFKGSINHNQFELPKKLLITKKERRKFYFFNN